MSNTDTYPRRGNLMRDMFFEAIDYPVWLVDRDFILIDFNGPFEGYFREFHGNLPVAGNPALQSIEDPDIRREWEIHYDTAFQGKVSFRFLSNSKVWQTSLTPTKTEAGEVLICSIQRVYEGEDYQKNLSILLSRMPDLVMYEFEAGKKYISENAFRVTGFTPNELLNDPEFLIPHIHPNDREKVRQQISDFTHDIKQEILTLEYRFQHRYGHYIWIEERKMKCGHSREDNGINGFIIDMSTRKGAQIDVALADTRFRTFMNFHPGLAWIKNEDFRYIFCNKTLKDLFDLSSSCENGLTTDFDLFEPQQAERMRVQEEKLLKDAVPQDYLETLHLPNSEIRHFQFHRFLLPGREGKQLIAGMAYDVTRQIKDQETLRQNEELFRVLAICSRDMISIHDKNTRFTYVSPSSEALSGYQPSELTGKVLLELIHPDDLPDFHENYRQALDGHDDKRLEYRLRKKDGNYLWVETLLTLVFNEQNNYTGFQATTRDVSERKFSEEKVGVQHQLLKDILDIIPTFLFVKDENKRLLFANRAFFEIAGLSSEELLTRKFSDLKNAPQSLKDFEKADDEVLTSIEELVNHEKLQGPNASVRHLHTVRKRIKLSDGTIRIVGIGTDISPIIESEKKMRFAHDEMKNFIYKASHDLKGPLSSILGLANLAENSLKDAESLKYMGMISDRTKKLSELLDDLLKIAHITAEKVILEKVNFKELVDAIINEQKYQNRFENVCVEIRNNSDSDFIGNRSMLMSIFQNLIVNSIKYRSPEREACIVIGIENKGQEFTISFNDNGVGIDEKSKEKIFEIFYRAQNDVSGSGLGLYIVKKSVERLGGSIELESTPGEGSTFIVKIISNHINSPDEKTTFLL